MISRVMAVGFRFMGPAMTLTTGRARSHLLYLLCVIVVICSMRTHARRLPRCSQLLRNRWLLGGRRRGQRSRQVRHCCRGVTLRRMRLAPPVQRLPGDTSAACQQSLTLCTDNN